MITDIKGFLKEVRLMWWSITARHASVGLHQRLDDSEHFQAGMAGFRTQPEAYQPRGRRAISIVAPWRSDLFGG
jgi:hypothetical protein